MIRAKKGCAPGNREKRDWRRVSSQFLSLAACLIYTRLGVSFSRALAVLALRPAIVFFFFAHPSVPSISQAFPVGSFFVAALFQRRQPSRLFLSASVNAIGYLCCLAGLPRFCPFCAACVRVRSAPGKKRRCRGCDCFWAFASLHLALSPLFSLYIYARVFWCVWGRTWDAAWPRDSVRHLTFLPSLPGAARSGRCCFGEARVRLPFKIKNENTLPPQASNDK